MVSGMERLGAASSFLVRGLCPAASLKRTSRTMLDAAYEFGSYEKWRSYE
jgi:hypothetical protein